MGESRIEQRLAEFGSERRINLGLERFTEALKKAGQPQKAVESLVIAGTNGKGTTTLFTSAALTSAGKKTVTYLSPHLQSVRERFLYGMRPISEEELIRLIEEWISLARETHLSYFEFLTLLVFVWAKRLGADVLVLEVGLGGRLDATNVTEPRACAITNIAFDHQAYLGNTLSQILTEKMGVLRRNGKLVSGIQDPALIRQVKEKCILEGIDLSLSSEIPAACLSRDWSGQKVQIDGHEFHLFNPSPGTLQNAVLAYGLLRKAYPNLPISLIQSGISRTRNPGRMEIVSENPRVVLSGDHNPAGVECLVASLGGLNTGNIITVCGFSPDKPYREMIERLRSFSSRVIVTQVDRLKDSMPEDYKKISGFVAPAREAVREALKLASPKDTLLITGSLYLVGELRPLWRSEVESFQVP